MHFWVRYLRFYINRYFLKRTEIKYIKKEINKLTTLIRINKHYNKLLEWNKRHTESVSSREAHHSNIYVQVIPSVGAVRPVRLLEMACVHNY